MFDEPSSYLDVKQRIKAAQAIRRLIRHDRFIIVIEHNLSILDYLSDYICCLYGSPGLKLLKLFIWIFSSVFQFETFNYFNYKLIKFSLIYFGFISSLISIISSISSRTWTAMPNCVKINIKCVKIKESRKKVLVVALAMAQALVVTLAVVFFYSCVYEVHFRLLFFRFSMFFFPFQIFNFNFMCDFF